MRGVYFFLIQRNILYGMVLEAFVVLNGVMGK